MDVTNTTVDELSHDAVDALTGVLRLYARDRQVLGLGSAAGPSCQPTAEWLSSQASAMTRLPSGVRRSRNPIIRVAQKLAATSAPGPPPPSPRRPHSVAADATFSSLARRHNNDVDGNALTLRFVHPKAVLCGEHERGLDAWLVRALFVLLANEVTARCDRIRAWRHRVVRRQEKSMRKSTEGMQLDDAERAAFDWIRRMDAVNALWLDCATFDLIFPAEDAAAVEMLSNNDAAPLPPKMANRCEACVLAYVGTDLRTLVDLRASTLSRGAAAREALDREIQPRLERYIDAWIGWTASDGMPGSGSNDKAHARAAEVHEATKQADKLAQHLLTVRARLREGRRLRRQERRAERDAAREQESERAGTGAVAGSVSGGNNNNTADPTTIGLARSNTRGHSAAPGPAFRLASDGNPYTPYIFPAAEARRRDQQRRDDEQADDERHNSNVLENKHADRFAGASYTTARRLRDLQPQPPLDGSYFEDPGDEHDETGTVVDFYSDALAALASVSPATPRASKTAPPRPTSDEYSDYVPARADWATPSPASTPTRSDSKRGRVSGGGGSSSDRRRSTQPSVAGFTNISAAPPPLRLSRAFPDGPAAPFFAPDGDGSSQKPPDYGMDADFTASALLPPRDDNDAAATEWDDVTVHTFADDDDDGTVIAPAPGSELFMGGGGGGGMPPVPAIPERYNTTTDIPPLRRAPPPPSSFYSQDGDDDDADRARMPPPPLPPFPNTLPPRRPYSTSSPFASPGRLARVPTRGSSAVSALSDTENAATAADATAATTRGPVSPLSTRPSSVASAKSAASSSSPSRRRRPASLLTTAALRAHAAAEPGSAAAAAADKIAGSPLKREASWVRQVRNAAAYDDDDDEDDDEEGAAPAAFLAPVGPEDSISVVAAARTAATRRAAPRGDGPKWTAPAEGTLREEEEEGGGSGRERRDVRAGRKSKRNPTSPSITSARTEWPDVRKDRDL